MNIQYSIYNNQIKRDINDYRKNNQIDLEERLIEFTLLIIRIVETLIV